MATQTKKKPAQKGTSKKSSQKRNQEKPLKERIFPPKGVTHIASNERLEDMLQETEVAMAQLQPKIERLEQQLDKLNDLKLAKQKLITLKLSLKSILSNFTSNIDSTSEKMMPFVFDQSEVSNMSEASLYNKASSSTKAFSLVSEKDKALLKTSAHLNPSAVFVPEKAFHEGASILRRKTTVNYHLFQAIVLNGGKASTEEIRHYLIEQGVQQPTHGQGFEEVPLTDISSRVNYLVRKGLIQPDERGHFIACVGWETK